MRLSKKITKKYDYKISLSRSGLVAIFISARCLSKKQNNSVVDEDLRVEINGLRFKEIPSRKKIQLFNIPSAWNGAKLRGLKKTVVFLTILKVGEQLISLIPKNSAFVEDIDFKELSIASNINLKIEERAEDGNRRPWYTFVLIDLPLSQMSSELTVERRLWDSDDVKIIVDNEVKRNIRGGKYKFWPITGNVLGWLIFRSKGESKKNKVEFEENLERGIHYLEFYADRMPILHQVNFNLNYSVTKSETRASEIIKDNKYFIIEAAKEFKVDPVIVGSVIYQEQSTNVNFVDFLGDYIGSLFHVNTSIGIGQVRVKTAEALENIYPELDPGKIYISFPDYNVVRVERLKDPFTNIRYAAAKIFFSQDRWKNAGFDISGKPEILGTLYNIEEIDNPVIPHAEPQPNEFGTGVKENYLKVKRMLEL